MPEPSSTHDAALAAHDAGLCVVRTRTDGTKSPLGKWKQYQSVRPTRDLVAQWFADGHPGVGIITGAVSGNLEMLELEGRFMAEIGHAPFMQAAADRGLELLVRRIITGLVVVSPSDGRHFLYRVDGPVDGNTKLARRPATDTELATNPDDTVKTLIETRGEGGFVVTAPSHGPVHPTGRPWQIRTGNYADIPTITPDERDALFELARSFDVPIPPPPPVTVTPSQRTKVTAHAGTVGDSWFDATVAHLDTTTSVRDELERHGWDYCYADAHGRELLRRPGKDQGVSGSINANGRFLPFSTSVPFEVGGKPPSTYDVLDVIAAYEYGGDRQAAGRAIAEQTGILDTWKRQQDNLTFTAGPPSNVDPETGEITNPLNLPDEFWNARPALAHIRQAAHSRLVSADAALIATLARVSTLTPPCHVLPPIVGGHVSLNLFAAIIDPSGGGKSAAVSVARQLITHTRDDIVDPILPSSGEGLIEAFFQWVTEDVDGKQIKVKKQVKTAGFAYVDEGQALLAQADRSGSTIMETIRSAWMGGDIGQHNAAEERKRWLGEHAYRLAIVMGFQLTYAAELITNSEGGTPQRFTFASATDPSADDHRDAQWPGPLPFHPPPTIVTMTSVKVDDEIVDGIRERRAGRVAGRLVVDPLDTHVDVRKLKLAAALAVLDGRTNITIDDWELAEQVDATSCAVRTHAVTHAHAAKVAAQRASTAVAVEREVAIDEAKLSRSLLRAARTVARRVWREGPQTHPQAYRALHSRYRVDAPIEDVIPLAVAQKWLAVDGEMVARGEVEP